jgi:hypothetical protein
MAGAYAVVAVGVPLDERKVLVGADQRPRVAGQSDDGQGAEDGVDRAPFQPESAKVRTGQERAWCLEEFGRRWLPPVNATAVLGAWRRSWAFRLELELLRRTTSHRVM